MRFGYPGAGGVVGVSSRPGRPPELSPASCILHAVPFDPLTTISSPSSPSTPICIVAAVGSAVGVGRVNVCGGHSTIAHASASGCVEVHDDHHTTPRRLPCSSSPSRSALQARTWSASGPAYGLSPVCALVAPRPLLFSGIYPPRRSDLNLNASTDLNVPSSSPRLRPPVPASPLASTPLASTPVPTYLSTSPSANVPALATCVARLGLPLRGVFLGGGDASEYESRPRAALLPSRLPAPLDLASERERAGAAAAGGRVEVQELGAKEWKRSVRRSGRGGDCGGGWRAVWELPVFARLSFLRARTGSGRSGASRSRARWLIRGEETQTYEDERSAVSQGMEVEMATLVVKLDLDLKLNLIQSNPCCRRFLGCRCASCTSSHLSAAWRKPSTSTALLASPPLPLHPPPDLYVPPSLRPYALPPIIAFLPSSSHANIPVEDEDAAHPWRAFASGSPPLRWESSVGPHLERSVLSLDWVLSSGINTCDSGVSGVLSLPCEGTTCVINVNLAIKDSLPFDLVLGHDWHLLCRDSLPNACSLLSSGPIDFRQPPSCTCQWRFLELRP
ncbi:hypothetical protein C8R45DRAFT_1109037 [Mycena sanguinolenta]|nr:hypothetical protein C8R45DRAFT_1109037 [Mycena sanguinolenta]